MSLELSFIRVDPQNTKPQWLQGRTGKKKHFLCNYIAENSASKVYKSTRLQKLNH